MTLLDEVVAGTQDYTSFEDSDIIQEADLTQHVTEQTWGCERPSETGLIFRVFAPMFATGVLTIAGFLGTGGSLPMSSQAGFAASPPTGAICEIEYTDGRASKREDNESEESVDLSDKMTTIRHFLSLNVSEMAEILHVSRPTVYAWARGEAPPHAPNQARIDRIYALAQRWAATATRPLGRYAHENLRAEGSILSMLAQDEIDDHAIQGLFAEAHRRIASVGGSRVKANALRYGFTERPKDEQVDALDREIGG